MAETGGNDDPQPCTRSTGWADASGERQCGWKRTAYREALTSRAPNGPLSRARNPVRDCEQLCRCDSGAQRKYLVSGTTSGEG